VNRRTRLPFSAIVGYGAGNFAFSMLGLVVAVNLQFFYTDYVGLSAGLVSWALLFARLFDAFVDPLMGWLSDRTHTRWGRRRPWMLGAALPLGLAFYGLFAPPLLEGQGALLGYLMLLYTGTFLLWTVGAIPYYSLGAELTDDYHERTQGIAVREGWGLAGLLCATILPAYLIHLRSGRDGYAAMGAILGTATALLLFGSGIASRERREFQGRASLNPYRGILRSLQNPHFRPLLAAFSLSAIAGAVPATLVIYVAVYIIGTPDWWTQRAPEWLPTWSYYLLLYFTSAVIALPFWSRVAAARGKKTTCVLRTLVVRDQSLQRDHRLRSAAGARTRRLRAGPTANGQRETLDAVDVFVVPGAVLRALGACVAPLPLHTPRSRRGAATGRARLTGRRERPQC
jgi:Na+/melibiose symporter-like transporter